ncbi:helicase-related protein [Brachybacterium paraconglomeratum]|uniref:helicase-related protein n=1 Tax=Brachybacterium paraconglomeratum TaxID=173362 RepID=UPI00249335D4|nr:helicase-related protein [Brachybacterium paraconglomeratum]
MASSALSPKTLDVAPGDTVTVRDELWMIMKVEPAADGALVHVRGLSELVRDTTASFYEAIDTITPFDPRDVRVVGDNTPRYRRTRVQLEAMLRKAPVPLQDAKLHTSASMLADSLSYQRQAVTKALDPANIRPRLLIADAVGLGKTIEIGMILSELVARGRGERILVVTPRSVLEQMQAELWNRFALPFVRLDSTGIQWIRRHLPASRNPFSYFSRAIISVDTLKSERFRPQLENVSWDAVVIDESHNLTNAATQNNELARLLAPRTEALILASATPHNGRDESFAELLRLLDPTAVQPDGSFSEEDVRRLVIRRHRHSPEVAAVVGADWAERAAPENLLISPSTSEDAVADELATRWLHPATGRSPYSGRESRLFPWTLAKSFLSSPAALEESLANRLRSLTGSTQPESVPQGAAPGSTEAEVEALQRLRDLNAASLATASSAKFRGLVEHLRRIGVGKSTPTRVVVFAERLATLNWLQRDLPKKLGLKPENVTVLHGGLSDVEQQAVIESFKLDDSPIRVLVAGDMASEGVNLHTQCHHLVHYDIPWSLIRIEQRNGRIDRYGQRERPQIASLVLRPTHEEFSGDLRILSKLVERADSANRRLGGVAGVMGEYSVSKEESEIEKVLAGRRSIDDVLATDDEAVQHDPLADLDFDDFFGDENSEADTAPPAEPKDPSASEIAARFGLFPGDADFLDAAVHLAFIEPSSPLARGGVAWIRDKGSPFVELTPPPDLRSRLTVLPQSYVAERRVHERLRLATTTAVAQAELTAARGGENPSSWPRAHFLSPLHPVLDWAADRALASLDRREVPVVRGASSYPVVLFLGTLLNERGQVVTRAFVNALFLAPLPKDSGTLAAPLVQPIEDLAEQFAEWGLNGHSSNPGPVQDPGFYSRHVREAFPAVTSHLELTGTAVQEQYKQQLAAFEDRYERWEHGAVIPLLRTSREQKDRVEREKQVAQSLRPTQWSLRALLVVEPLDGVEGRN